MEQELRELKKWLTFALQDKVDTYAMSSVSSRCVGVLK